MCDVLNVLIAQRIAKLIGAHGQVGTRTEPGCDLLAKPAGAQTLHEAREIAEACTAEYIGEWVLN